MIPSISGGAAREFTGAPTVHDLGNLDAAYDAHGSAVHAYCWSMLRDDNAACDVVEETFVVAFERSDRLRDPSMFRAWLFALARNGCLRRLGNGRRSRRSAPTDAAERYLVTARHKRAEDDLPTLVYLAAEALDQAEREILELTLSQRLDSSELAAVLGVTPGRSRELLARAREQFARLVSFLSFLRGARTSREMCPELDRLLVGWNGRLTPSLRQRLARHMKACPACPRRMSASASPTLYTVLPAIGVPLPLRKRVLRAVGDLGAADHRADVVRAAGPFDRAGFPRPGDRQRYPARVRNAAAAAVAAGAAVATAATLSPASANNASGDGGHAASAVAAVPGAPVASTTASPLTTSAGLPSAAPTGGAAAQVSSASTSPTASAQAAGVLPQSAAGRLDTAVPNPASSPASAGSASPLTTTSTPSAAGGATTVTAQVGAGGATTTPAAPLAPAVALPGGAGPAVASAASPPQLAVSTTAVAVPTAGSAQFTLTAVGGPLSWSAFVDSSSLLVPYGLSQHSGTLAAGQSVTVTVQAGLGALTDPNATIVLSNGADIAVTSAGLGLPGGL